METRIGNDIILDVDPKIFGVNGTDSIESTEAIFVRYEEPCCHDNCCSQFCNPAPYCNGGCNYYNASPVNIYGIPTHCPPTKQYQYVDKINTVQNTDRIKYNYPGSKQAVYGLFDIIIVAYLKNKKTATIKLDDTIRIVEKGAQETVTIKVDSNITTSEYNIYIGFGKETIDSVSDIKSLSNTVHYVLKDVSKPDTEDGAYHITSTSENIKNTNADNQCYIWVCSQQNFKRLTSNGFTMPSESTIVIGNYYCKRVSNPITVTGDNVIEIIK